MTDDWSGIIQRHVDAILKARADSIEHTVEAALQGGEHGVAVINRDGVTLSIVDPLVPYGHIFEFLTPAAYQAFKERNETAV